MHCVDPLSSFALMIAIAGAGFYVLFLVIRAAVAQALRDHHQAILEATREGPSRM
jgi:hypothetical protein